MCYTMRRMGKYERNSMTERSGRKIKHLICINYFSAVSKIERRTDIMRNLNVTVKGKMDRIGDMALKGVASAALKVTTVNVRTCCWFVLGQDKLPDGAEKLRRI